MWTVLAVFLLTISGTYAQRVTHTNGTGGEPCPERRCLASRADCIDNKCICRAPFELDPDNGNFACYRSNQVFSEVKNDPTIRNFNDETAAFQYPCRHLQTSTQTNLRIQKEDYGTCECQLHSWNEKFRGKFFVGGFDFACLITNRKIGEKEGFSVRIEGIARNGQYTYTEHSTLTYAPNGPWTTSPLNASVAGVHVHVIYDTVNNQARIALPECGYQISFLAYDIIDAREQEQIPGLSVGVNCGLNPFFFEHDRVTATAPVRFGGITYKELAQNLSLTVPEAILYRAFTSNVVQNQPDASPQCATVGGFLRQCSVADRRRAADRCLWMLSEPRFIRCLDRGTDVSPVLRLIQTCVSFYCTSRVSCEGFVDAVLSTNCGTVSDIKELSDIASGSICE